MNTDIFIAFVKLLASYIFLCILYPAFILHPFIKNKDLAYRVMFVQVAMNLYITFWGFVFGLTNTFSSVNLWITLILIPLVLRIYLSRKTFVNSFSAGKQVISDVQQGIYGRRLLRRHIAEKIVEKLKKFFNAYIRENAVQILVFSAVSVFIIYYFGYFKLHNYAYAYTDEETHLYWIQSLINGSAFPAGLYPHAMHFLVASLTTMFGLQVVISWHVFSILSTLLIFWSLYMLLRRLFSSVVASSIGLIIFCLLDLFDILTYYRFQYSLPMEFGFVSLFITICAILYYIQEKDRLSLLFFLGALIWTFEVHFYITIAAVFVFAAGMVVYLIPMIREKIFHKIVIGCIISALIMIAPFAIGYLAGHNFERSISWGLAIMSGADDDTLSETLGDNSQDISDTLSNLDLGKEDDSVSDKTEDELIEEALESMEPDKRATYTTLLKLYQSDIFKLNSDDLSMLIDSIEGFEINNECAETYILHHIHSISGVCNLLMVSMLKIVTDNLTVTALIWILELTAFLYGLLGIVLSLLRKKKCDRYLLILFASLLWFSLYFCYLMPSIGLPSFLLNYRTAELLALFTPILFCVPFQIVYDLLGFLKVRKGTAEITLLAAVIIAAFLQRNTLNDCKKNLDSLFYDIAIQNIDLKLCSELIENEDDFTWTIISPVNDLSVIRYQGYHYEITDLLENIEKGETEIYIPTEYIYIVVEEDIINFYTDVGDRRKIDGSDYMAYSYAISPELAKMSLNELGIQNFTSTDRAYYEIRQAVMSKLYYWVEKMKEVYPSEITLYDEDEHCKVYRIKQDPYFLLNLSVDYESEIK